MKSFYCICIGFALTGCTLSQSDVSSNTFYEKSAQSTYSSSSSAKNELTQVDVITESSDGMQWLSYFNSDHGIAFDYPATTWGYGTTEPKTYVREISVQSFNAQEKIRWNVADVSPDHMSVIVLGIQNSNPQPEFIFYTDTVDDEYKITDLVRRRFGTSCRIQSQPMDDDLVNIQVRLGDGEDIMNTQCKFPNVADTLLYSKSRKKMVSLFMGQEVRFPSKDRSDQLNHRVGHDGLIKRSLRFVDYDSATGEWRITRLFPLKAQMWRE
ncbi:MAG: hypothetical protein PHU04_02940 [Candidatus Peribacteraceae bacterium]|nr:hypothetical protein [Candidatus Peribacteraceae bacterium]